MYSAETLARNIRYHRIRLGLSQKALSLHMQVSVQAVSKWERGLASPELHAVYELSRLFGVTVDYLLCSVHEEPAHVVEEEAAPAPDPISRQSIRTRGVVTGMSILLVWLAALTMFLIFDTAEVDVRSHWIVFACAVPASLVLWLVMNSIWFNRRRNYLIISLLMWSVLILAFVTVWIFAQRALWLISLPGIPGQAIIVMWSRLKQTEDAAQS